MTGAPARRRPSAREIALVVVWLLAFASIVSWRQGVLYTGGSDPVVIAKAAVAGFGLLGALVLWRAAPRHRVLSPFPTLLIVAIVGISLVGAIQAGALLANAVLVVRIGLLAATILLIMVSTTSRTAITTMLVAMASIGVFAAATHELGRFTSGGGGGDRLSGGIPPLEPNELATLVLPAAIGLLFLVVRNGLRLWPVAGLLLLTVIIYETGSRTALAMLAVGAVVLVLRERRLTLGVALLGLVGVVGAYVVVMFSSTVADLTLRGKGVDSLLTLNSRTISWSAVLQTPSDEWAWWIGNGLSMKSIAVLGQYWKTQVFDSSWISSIAQDGMIGTALLALYVLGTLLATARRRSLDSVAFAIVVTLFIRSFFENGLIESSATFAVFFTIALAAWPGTRELRRRDRAEVVVRRTEPRELPVPAWSTAPR